MTKNLPTDFNCSRNVEYFSQLTDAQIALFLGTYMESVPIFSRSYDLLEVIQERLLAQDR